MAAQGTKVGSIHYEVEADTSKLVNSSSSVDASLAKLNQQFKKTDKAANDTQFAMTKTAAAVRGLGRESATASAGIGGLSKALGGLLTLRGIGSLIQMAEAYGEMAERIQMATSSQAEYELVQSRLLKTANGTYRALSEAQEVYILTADSLRSMGYETSEVLDITDSLSYSFVKNATSADRAANTTRAYTNAIMKGKVEADGWATIVSAIPSIIQDIATASGRSAEEIRKMGAEGKLTTSLLNEGLLQSLDSNKAAADGMATTVKDAFTAMRNSLSVYVGEANRASGTTEILSGAILLLSENIDTIVKLLMVAGASALAKYIAQLGASAIASGRAMLAARAHAAEELNLAKSHAAATSAALAQAQANVGLTGGHGAAKAAADAHSAALTRLAAAQKAVVGVGRTLVGLLGGPVGIIALVASAGAAFATMGGNARNAAPEIDRLTDSIDKLTQAQIELRQQQAGEFADQLRKDLISAGKEVRGLERDYAALKKMAAEGRGVDAAGLENVRKTLVEARAEMDGTRQDLDKVIKAEKELSDAQANRRAASSGSAPAKESDPEVEKRLQAMRDELELAKLTGVARARLQAIQKLGASATQEERAEAERLAEEIYKLESAQKNLKKETKDGTVFTKENAKVISELSKELYQAGLSGETLAVVKARLRLNDAATPEEVARVEALARAIHKVAEEEKNRDLLKQVDPIANEQIGFADQIENLRKLNEAKLLEDQRYLELKAQVETAHDEKMRALQEENFRRQSVWNDLLMGSIDQVGKAATDSFIGVVTGSQSGEDAIRSLAGAIMQQAVGAFIEMGVAQVKAWIMGKTAQAAAGAAYAASVSGQVAANTALAAQGAFAATAAIPYVGPILAPAAAAAAGAAAGALGAPAIASSALVAASGRQYGGPVAPNKMHRINENGQPEVLNMANGRQYLLPNSRGEVVSNKDATRGGGEVGRVTVIVNNAPPGTTTDQQSGLDGETVLAITIGDINSGGRLSQTIEGTYGLQRRGS